MASIHCTNGILYLCITLWLVWLCIQFCYQAFLLQFRWAMGHLMAIYLTVLFKPLVFVLLLFLIFPWKLQTLQSFTKYCFHLFYSFFFFLSQANFISTLREWTTHSNRLPSLLPANENEQVRVISASLLVCLLSFFCATWNRLKSICMVTANARDS